MTQYNYVMFDGPTPSYIKQIRRFSVFPDLVGLTDQITEQCSIAYVKPMAYQTVLDRRVFT